MTSDPDVEVVSSYNSALNCLERRGEELVTCWVIGGSSVYGEALARSEDGSGGAGIGTAKKAKTGTSLTDFHQG